MRPAFRFLFQIRREQRDHRQQLLFVVRLLRTLGGHDHLQGEIDRDLRLVTRHEFRVFCGNGWEYDVTVFLPDQ
jgi:hypothetical protein